MKNATPRMVVEGQKAMRHNDGQLMLLSERTVIGPAGVQVEFSGIGENLNAAYVTSTNTAVIQYELDRAEARQRTTRINRPITSLFKTREQHLAANKRRRAAINVPASAFDIDPAHD